MYEEENLNRLDEGACLELYATYKLLDCLQEAHFSDADNVRQRVLVLTALPGGLGWLTDIFTVLTDAIRAKERACVEQHLAALVEMLNESIAEAQSLEAPPETVVEAPCPATVVYFTESAPPSAPVASCISRAPSLWFGAHHI
ncbi:MAG: hypothetical protein FWG75_08260 [Cystobacterineae bacterium]|nr:hypothetical protein [Cystobacterineae bacterium]